MFSESEFTRYADELLDLAHHVACELHPQYEDWYVDPEGSSGSRYYYFEVSMVPLCEGGVGYFANITEPPDCSCCPAPIFAHGKGNSLQEALDNLQADLLRKLPSYTVGDAWKPTLGDLMAN
jgi:hypothetical protein